METLQTICIALIQGITEFLPISSSAHIQLPTLLLGWQDQGLQFDIAVHGGSLLAVLAYFRHRLVTLATGTLKTLRLRELNNESDLLFKLIIATLPVVVVGFLIREQVATTMRDLSVIVLTTILFGLLLGVAEWRTRRLISSGLTFLDSNPNFFVVLLIGLAQVLALIPGTSRSGITISIALLVGLSRTQAATFSFLLAIPVIAGAFLLSLFDLSMQADPIDVFNFALGFLVAAVSAYLCISLFLHVIEKIGLWPFVIYRVAIGIWLGLVIWL